MSDLTLDSDYDRLLHLIPFLMRFQKGFESSPGIEQESFLGKLITIYKEKWVCVFSSYLHEVVSRKSANHVRLMLPM